MPSANKTSLGLNQWQGNEYLKRLDINQDNQIINDKLVENENAIKDNAANISNHRHDEDYLKRSESGNLAELETGLKDNLVGAINEVKGKTDIAQSTANQANSKADTAQVRADQAFQSGVDRKVEVVDALNSKKTIPVSTTDDPWNVLIPKISDIREGSGNAQKADVLAGKTFTNNDGVEYTGTMPNNAAVTITPGTTNKSIVQGYHNGSGYVVGDPDLVSANIKAGKNIFGVSGSANVVDTSAGTATAGQILSGQKAYVDGSLVTGAMANRGALTQTITSQGQQYTIPAGYHSGAGKVSANFANLTPSNIRSGVNVGGVVGSLKEIKFATGHVLSSTDTKYFPTTGSSEYEQYYVQVSNIGFYPTAIIVGRSRYSRDEYTWYSSFIRGGERVIEYNGTLYRVGVGTYSNPSYVDEGRFLLPVGISDEGYEWVAFG